MLAVARRLLRVDEDARDAVQDAFLLAFKSFAQFREGSRLYTWLHRIVINAALMKLRKRMPTPAADLDALLPRFHDDGHAVNPSPDWRLPADALAQRRELRLLVRRCIDELPEDYRSVLMLRDIEELNTEETAQLLGMTTGAVKTRLHRARQALRTLLDPHLRGYAA
jgi:RNA polymerase sigma-70 factor (ECF subfamily)